MANSFDTSFIPQQPLLKSEGFSRRRESISLILVISLVVFFSTLAVFGGLYFYKASVEKAVKIQEDKLQSREKGLNLSEIKKYQKINDQIRIAQSLLNQHKAFSGVLEFIEKVTAQRVGWTTFSYKLSEKDGTVLVSLIGLAPNYRVAYAQVEQLRQMDTELKKVEVMAPTLDLLTGAVSFTVNLVIDPSIIKYKEKGVTMDSAAQGVVTPSDIPQSTTP